MYDGRRVLEDTPPGNLVFLLRAHRPEKLREKFALKSRRRELHRAVAEASALVEAQPEVVAQHWEAAGEAERATSTGECWRVSARTAWRTIHT